MRFTAAPLSSTSNRQRVRADGGSRESDTNRSAGSNRPESLLVVSNRQPYRHKYDDGEGGNEDGDDRPITVDEPAGGLTAGLDPVVQEVNGTWIAWGDGDADFTVADENNCVSVPPGEDAYTLRRIDLSEEAVESYYYGFSNRVLWPLCHGFTDLICHRSNDFDWYQTVNERFADAVADHASEDSVVWVQDYHFALAPRLIQDDDSVPESTTIAQFWHIPWPTPSALQRCPAAGHLLEGVLGNDLLGFHVEWYADRFLECVEQFLPAADVNRTQRTVSYDGHTTRIVATPMGVNASAYDQDARAVDAAQISTLLGDECNPDDVVLGLGVDRLDYTKGIPERFAALERFFERNPDWRGEFTFVQKSTPSRTNIPAYQHHGELVRGEAKRINHRFGTDEWQPIIYTEAYLEHETLCGLYRHADVMVVNPLIDGMNLVAQEFVASNVDATGTLVLSERAGAHDRLGSHAVSIDPTDVTDIATGIEEALAMPIRERQRRMTTLRNRVFDGNLERWMDAQFDWIEHVHSDSSDTDSPRDSSEFRPHEPTA
ncbi:trehalose-6-phosphate synthase [Natronolimnobius sp. AArcel1]|uniref:alpha,alpha-trehalose-phosphate synthase (UDP-forming) n=1 Tax=Natronolimnobius sp. AArcel1 TaxID=1679093 RepID=UPI0013EB255B|nr:trehalose-6-phosphate synthase [Natronolimnobius sp. AArcel1]NGM71522.1 trehalose-6-phosphate synthase [Natronolimnobius sp. AArcel1]